MVVQQKVERQRSEKPGISSNYISPLTIRDNQPGESFSLAKCAKSLLASFNDDDYFIPLSGENSSLLRSQPLSPKLSSYQSRPLQAPLLSTLLPPLQTTPFSESTPSKYQSTRVSQPTCPRMMRIYLTICVTGSAVKILALDKLKIECARFSNSAQLSIFQLNLRTHVLFFIFMLYFHSARPFST